MGRSFSGALLRATYLLVLVGSAKGQTSPLSDLPWDDLKSKLGPSTLLVDPTPADYVTECLPAFQVALEDRSNYAVIDQPSGVCMNHLACGFERCNPLLHEKLTVNEWWAENVNFETLEVSTFGNVEEDWLFPTNPSYNLPHKVLFPRAAGDVYAAVDFAKQHGIELSVKNSGHSYTGASTKKDTLLLNMNQFIRYSNATGGLVGCGVQEDISSDLGNQPCQLALARNKPAVLRVGGGENFDKVYRAVKAWNEAQSDGYKYHLVGGAAGSVSPMGWTFQGGLSSTTNGRTHGLGVDQVLQVEMVLPLGQHVRFGPTKWEDTEGYQYPRTMEVSGVCNEMPYEDESSWVWTTCPDDINFDELWFAVNGGGGGTYGIVTSVYLQLHDYLPVKVLTFGGASLFYSPCNIPFDPANFPLIDTVWSFQIDFLLNPTSLPNVTVDMSNRCGAPGSGRASQMYCFGDAMDGMLAAWTVFVADQNETLVEKGVPISSIDRAAVCYDEGVVSWTDFATSILKSKGPWAGQADDHPRPDYTSNSEIVANVLYPKTFILENKEAFIAGLNNPAVLTSPYWAFGGNAATAQDQSNSVSDAHREAGAMLYFAHQFLDETFFGEDFPLLYDVTGDSFPGFIGSNHAGPNTRGPLKDDWSKPCPLDLTPAERDAKCIPLQEAIWGTEVLARLEAVKDAVDPNRMLDCYGCVGNNRDSVDASSPPDDSGPADLGADDSGPDDSGALSLATASVAAGAVLGCMVCLL